MSAPPGGLFGVISWVMYGGGPMKETGNFFIFGLCSSGGHVIALWISASTFPSVGQRLVIVLLLPDEIFS